MKKLMCKLVVLCAAAALFCAFASAESAIETEAAEGYQSTVTMADVNQERVSVAVTGVEEGKQYLLIAQNADAAPTESNIIYINQDTSSGTSVSFDVFPKELETDKTYYVFLSSDASSGTITARALVGTFVLKEVQEEEYPVGDTDGDGFITALDADLILDYIANRGDARAKLNSSSESYDADLFRRANTNSADTRINMNDALQIFFYDAFLPSTLS